VTNRKASMPREISSSRKASLLGKPTRGCFVSVPSARYICPQNQNAINGSVIMIRTGTLSTCAGNCGLSEFVLST
jgi:hypothetical protein